MGNSVNTEACWDAGRNAAVWTKTSMYCKESCEVGSHPQIRGGCGIARLRAQKSRKFNNEGEEIMKMSVKSGYAPAYLKTKTWQEH